MNALVVKTFELKKEHLPAIAMDWNRLEKLSSRSFFTSWKWIGCWLKMIDYKSNVITVHDRQELIGLAFFNQHKDRRTTYSTNQLWINRTGERAKDQIWSEYNDILCPRGREWAVRTAVLEHLTSKFPDIDEYVLGVSREEVSETPCPTSLFPRTIWETESYSTQLIPSFKNLDSYLATLSKNTRHQIRRSIKLLKERGNVYINRAYSLTEARSMLEHAGKLHRHRWSGTKSGFSNPYFLGFHDELIKRHFESGCIDIICLMVGDEPISYLYNFVHDDYVYFYLSGIKYERDNRIKPGLVAHALAISNYAEQGRKTYDFMGGRGQYKASLCNHREHLVITSFQRKRPLLLFKRWVNEARSYWRPTGTLLNERE